MHLLFLQALLLLLLLLRQQSRVNSTSSNAVVVADAAVLINAHCHVVHNLLKLLGFKARRLSLALVFMTVRLVVTVLMLRLLLNHLRVNAHGPILLLLLLLLHHKLRVSDKGSHVSGRRRLHRRRQVALGRECRGREDLQ